MHEYAFLGRLVREREREREREGERERDLSAEARDCRALEVLVFVPVLPVWINHNQTISLILHWLLLVVCVSTGWYMWFYTCDVKGYIVVTK